jgi:peptidoglycan/xylan/chitin deacetylase (PgdA/CDA1 family)
MFFMAGNRVLILNYHRISATEEKGNIYTVRTPEFAAQLDVISELKIPVVSINDLAGTDRKFSVAFTFDDGYASDHDIAYPLMKQFGYPAAFFPIVNRIGEQGYQNWQQLKKLHEAGCVIGSHGITHTILPKMTLEQEKAELVRSKKILTENLNCSVEYFAAPYGRYSGRTEAVAKRAGYKRLFGTGLIVNSTNANSFVFHRWNITSKMSIQDFKKVVSSHGNLPVSTLLASSITHYAKKVIGPDLVKKFNRLF